MLRRDVTQQSAFHVVYSHPSFGLFSYFQMIYVLCVYNQKEKEHQITVSSNASILNQNHTPLLFI